MSVRAPGLPSVAVQSERQRGGRGSILSRQSRDHAVLQSLMLAYEHTPSVRKRAKIVDTLAERALRHAFAEETVLFPAYRKYLGEQADELSAHIEGEHQAVNEMLVELQSLDPHDPEFDRTVRKTFAVIRDDARNEEDALLPQLQQVATGRQLRAIGRAWEVSRRTSPTRPHPKVSRRPPGNLLAALPLAVSDRAKDAAQHVVPPASGVRVLGAGLLAGAAGVAVMTLGEKVEQALTGRPNSYVPSRVLERLTGLHPADEAERDVLNLAMHWGQGTLLGVVRAAMARRGVRGASGAVAFTGLRLAVDQTLENGTGVGAPPWTWPRDELVIDVAHKAVYAVVTGSVADRLVRTRG
ncbi:hemerythrin domain-containing protein [Motilibacter deserti]|uniref:Hemerythrin domain-containing protein n=1 Tax=Motilibacter deserti TaxID=2714956 RepID=A0ABX0GUB6_9ACTN|nr:hemerythrin domain-containing protein [Motilibacter deserti]NHC13306.1 hemerythrin domain-containing protein [Motilibacter deserti]